ncbi:Mannosyl-oligosaccharide 1,2-alpha-mannosidase IB, partial [Fragariocoptes setiger]
MKHAWDGYTRYAWGYNELRPISKEPHYGSVFHGEKMGATIVDGIDTLFIMGMHDKYMAARNWIEQNLDFASFNGELSVFETNIRFVGGLLSIYALTKDQMFLAKAVQCAQKLLPAFDTPSGIPRAFVNMRTGDSRNADWTFGGAILSEFGSIHLEFAYLSYATGDPIYLEKVSRVRRTVKMATPRDDGLYNNYIDVSTGQWLTSKVHVSMGGLGDSFYEYLLKAYVQSGKRDVEALHLYNDAIRALERKLIFTSNQSRLVYFGEYVDGSVVHKMGTLACFSGGMLAMGGMHQETAELRNHYIRLGAEIARTCRESCVRANASIGPEAFVFTKAVEARAYRVDDKAYLLRPEILETYFYMWRYTHNPTYREWAWDFAQALDRYCRVEAGYSGLRNVYDPNYRNLDDVQQSFFLAEVLKYLYLIFSDDQLLSLDDWVFNTEAHPLPILKNITSTHRLH